MKKEMSKDLVVVVPIYKLNFTPGESVSLKRLISVLGKHEIVFVMPEKYREIKTLDKGYNYEYFADTSFRSHHDYSNLLLDESFYRRFDNYRYMLIYQLDAFVFNDTVSEFMDLGFDYIGAPVDEKIWPGMKEYILPQEGYYVGNGGLCLRKIDSCLRVLEKKEEVFYARGWTEKSVFGEDEFFSFCGIMPELEFHVASIDVAKRFSIQHTEAICDTSDIERLFGCHAWTYWDQYLFWKPIINKYYRFDDEYIIKEIQWQMARNELFNYLTLDKNKDKCHEIVQSIIPHDRKLALWGMGAIGRRVASFLTICNIEIEKIGDENQREVFLNMEIVSPKQLMEAGVFIIVTTTRFKNEVEHRLNANGLKKNHDYLLYDDFIRGLIDSYSKIMGMNKEMIYEDLYTYYGNQTYDGKVRFLNI